jgi:hypothetical protein
MTEALQVNLDETFCSIAQTELNRQCGAQGRAIEVLNFGVSSYGTAQQLLALREHVWEYQPDAVLLVMFLGNDLMDNSKTFSTGIRPFFRRQGDRLELDRARVERAGYLSPEPLLTRFSRVLLDHSRLIQLLNRARVRSSSPQVASLAKGALFREPEHEDWIHAWKITEEIIDGMRAEIRERSLEFRVVLASIPIQVHPDDGVRRSFAEEIGTEDLSYPNRRIREFCGAKGIPVLDLVPPLLEEARKGGQPLHGFPPTLGEGHWNQRGHLAAGGLIARWLAIELFAPTRNQRPGKSYPRD